MKIRYDAKGNILAVGDDACDWQGRVLGLAERELPADLLATFALGRYVVRDGKLAKLQVRPVAVDSPAKLLGIEPVPLDPAMFAPGAVRPPAVPSPVPAKTASTAGTIKRKRARPASRATKTARPLTAAKSVGARRSRAKRSTS